MIRALISTLFALSIFVCVVGQTIYGPTGSSPMFEPYIQSATGDVRGTLWVLANSTRYVTAINTNTGTTTVIDLAGSSNGTTPAVITRIRVAYSGLYGNVMFAQDVANGYVAMYSLDQQGALIRTINVFGYQTFQVSPSGGYLAVGGVEGSEYIDFIDVYATDGAGYMHRIQLTGLQSRGFAFNQMGDMLAVSIGLNNTISMIAAQTNIYIYSETFPLPIDGFAIDAIAIQGSTFTLVDCNQSSVVIANNREGFSYGFQFHGINMSQCGEAVTTLGQSSFAVLDGTYSMNYFGKISNTSSSSTGSAPSSTGVAPSTGYFPSGSSPVFGYDIQSVTSNFTGTMWVMTGSRQQQALQYTNYDGSTVWVDLTINQPSSSLPAVITRVRAANSNVYGNLLFMEDVANNWIAMYSLDYNFKYTGGFIRSINVFGYQTYQVSADARYLAVGGVMGSEYIDFIDMYNLTATNGDGYMYRIGLAGSQVRDFAFNDQTNFLYVPNGNNTMSTYNAMNGNSITYPIANLPPSFTAHAIAVDRRNSWALVDCDQGIVVMTDWLTQATTNYTLQRFNSSQCTEAVTTIGWSSFAVLNGGNRYSFFAYGNMAPSSTAPRSSSTGRASSTGVAPSSTGVAPSTGYTPSGNSPIIVDVMSGSGNVTGALWVISSSYQGPGAVLINTNTQASRFVQLTTNQPNSSLPAVITRVRPANHPAYGNLLFMEDSANNYIAMYALDNNRGFIRSINVFGYQTYQVSPDGRFLAVGGVAGSPYIDFIDMYDLTVTNGDGYMYRIELNGAQCRGFAFSILSRGWLFVPMGVNNTAVVYDRQMGTVVQWVFFPSSLQPFTIGAIAVDAGYNMALVDCDQGMVAFIPRSIQLATNYTLQQFNYTQCSEAVTTIGPYAFAVLTGGTLQGGNSYVYFEPSSISDEHWEVANDSSVSTVSSLSSVEIAFIIIGAVALFALVVASVIMLKARFVSKHKQVEGNSLLAIANQA